MNRACMWFQNDRDDIPWCPQWQVTWVTSGWWREEESEVSPWRWRQMLPVQHCYGPHNCILQAQLHWYSWGKGKCFYFWLILCFWRLVLSKCALWKKKVSITQYSIIQSEKMDQKMLGYSLCKNKNKKYHKCQISV